MHCDIYKSSKKDEMYLYVARPDYPNDENVDHLEKVPASMQQAFGRTTFVMHLEITPERKLARVSNLRVLDALETLGYFVQVPPEGLINPNAVEPEGLRGA